MPYRDVTDPPHRRTNKRKGKGRNANDRPPILGLIRRTNHEVRYCVLEHADKPTTRTCIEGNVPWESTILFTDEALNYGGAHPQPACRTIATVGEKGSAIMTSGDSHSKHKISSPY
jgi:hypothetical protein